MLSSRKPETVCEFLSQADKRHIRPFMIRYAPNWVTVAVYAKMKPVFIKMLVWEGEFLSKMDKIEKGRE